MIEPPLEPELDSLYRAAIADGSAIAALADWFRRHGNDVAARWATRGYPYLAVGEFLAFDYGYFRESQVASGGTYIWETPDGEELEVTEVCSIPDGLPLPPSMPPRDPRRRFVGLVARYLRRGHRGLFELGGVGPDDPSHLDWYERPSGRS